MARVEFSNWAPTLQAAWQGDFCDREHLRPGGARLDAAQFNDVGAVVVTAPAGAAAGATSIVVSALSGAIPAGTVLDFTGTGEITRTTALAAAGATSIAVEALDAAVEAGDTAVYAGTSRLKTVVSGTVVGRTFAERDAHTGYGPAADADDEIFLLAFDVTDALTNPDCELYEWGSRVKENFVPGFAGLSATVKAFLRTKYRCTIGAI